MQSPAIKPTENSSPVIQKSTSATKASASVPLPSAATVTNKLTSPVAKRNIATAASSTFSVVINPDDKATKSQSHSASGHSLASSSGNNTTSSVTSPRCARSLKLQKNTNSPKGFAVTLHDGANSRAVPAPSTSASRAVPSTSISSGAPAPSTSTSIKATTATKAAPAAADVKPPVAPVRALPKVRRLATSKMTSGAGGARSAKRKSSDNDDTDAKKTRASTRVGSTSQDRTNSRKCLPLRRHFLCLACSIFRDICVSSPFSHQFGS